MENTLERLGLKPEEILIYQCLHAHGALGASELSRRTNIKRPSVYVFVERLIQSGLVNQTMRSGVKEFLAEPPQKIRSLYEEKLSALKSLETGIEETITALQNHTPQSTAKPRMRFFEGQNALENLLKDSWYHNDTEVLTLWPIKSFQTCLSEDLLRYHNMMRLKNNLSVRAIWQDDGVPDEQRPAHFGSGKGYLREVRYAPKEMEFDMGYWIYENKAAFLSSKAENFGFLIESVELIQMLKIQHQVIWNISKPVSITPPGANLFFEEYHNLFTP